MTPFLHLFLLHAYFVAIFSASINPSDWNVIYNGYGNVTFDNGAVTLFPMASTSAGQTHAALVITKQNYTSYNVSITANTIKQLRQNTAPNAWEVFWVFFNYQIVGNNNEKNTNYFILKTNGVELGTASQSVAQQFLYTNNDPKLSINTYYQYNLIFNNDLDGGTVDIYINQTHIVTYKNDASAKKLFTFPGSIGLYCEDSKVQIVDFTISKLS